MSLKKRLILILLLTCTVLVISFLISFKVLILPPLKEKKISYVENLRTKVNRAIELERQHIRVLCQDWSDWGSMADYIKWPTEAFEKDAFPEESFTHDQLDMILAIDRQGKIIYHRTYWREKKYIPYSELKISKYIDIILKTILKKPASIEFFIETAHEPMLIVANPIFPPAQKGAPIPGILVLGKFLDSRMVNRISRYTMDDFEVYLTDTAQIDAFCTCPIKGKRFCFQEEKNKLFTFHPIKCCCGKPLVLLRGISDSTLFRVWDRYTISFISIIFFTVVFLGILLYRYIDRFMINRMRSISTTMNKIEGLADLSTRINKDRRRDEISQLIKDLNLTLDKLENEKIFRQNMERVMVTQGKLASIGRLTSNIAHEINNPLLAISNCVQVIKKNVKTKNELLDEAFEISESEIDRIRNIISVLLDFHRMDKEKYTDLNVKELINKSLEVLKWGKKLQAVQVKKNLSDNCYVYGSHIKLEEVFINFISNAVEAVEAVETLNGNGKIEIKVQPGLDKNMVEVHFIDNGPGLASVVRGSVFEPFVTTKEDSGVGLGLYIAYKIIKIHNGTIEYDDGYRDGAHFIIKLPVSKNKEV